MMQEKEPFSQLGALKAPDFAGDSKPGEKAQFRILVCLSKFFEETKFSCFMFTRFQSTSFTFMHIGS